MSTGFSISDAHNALAISKASLDLAIESTPEKRLDAGERVALEACGPVIELYSDEPKRRTGSSGPGIRPCRASNPLRCTYEAPCANCVATVEDGTASGKSPSFRERPS